MKAIKNLIIVGLAPNGSPDQKVHVAVMMHLLEIKDKRFVDSSFYNGLNFKKISGKIDFYPHAISYENFAFEISSCSDEESLKTTIFNVFYKNISELVTQGKQTAAIAFTGKELWQNPEPLIDNLIDTLETMEKDWSDNEGFMERVYLLVPVGQKELLIEKLKKSIESVLA
jgi:hypothetical protein